MIIYSRGKGKRDDGNTQLELIEFIDFVEYRLARL